MQWILSNLVFRYEDANGYLFPTVKIRDGEPLYSWRYSLENWLGPSLHLDKESYSHKWNSEYNKRYSSQPSIFFCHGNSTNTNILAITGKGTFFDEDHPGAPKSAPPDTIIIIEVKDSNIHWMEPGDINVEDLKQENTRGIFTEGVHVGFANGTVCRLSSKTPIENIKKLCYAKRPKEENKETLLGKYIEAEWVNPIIQKEYETQ